MEDGLPDDFYQQLAAAEEAQAELSVSKQEYREAIEKLWPHAESEAGGSRAAALVLLAAYDTRQWGFTLDDLAGLGYPQLRAALVVIRGRLVQGIEPHTLMHDGPGRFKRLSAQWAHLSLME